MSTEDILLSQNVLFKCSSLQQDFSPHSAKWCFTRVSGIPPLVGGSVALSGDERATRFPREAWASGGAARRADQLGNSTAPRSKCSASNKPGRTQVDFSFVGYAGIFWAAQKTNKPSTGAPMEGNWLSTGNNA